MKIISIEDLNLQHFQENNLNHDQIFSSHANHRYHGKTQFYLQANIQTILLCWCFGGLFVGFGLGFYLWWWWFLTFFPLYIKWVAREAVQSRVPRSLLQVPRSWILDAITPLWPLEVRGVGQKNLSKNQLRSGWYLQANSNLPNLWLWGNFTRCFPGSRGLCTTVYATAAESLLCSVNCPI